MESKFKSTTVLDLLFQAAKTTPSKTYCKSADHEFTYQNFIGACIKLSKKISNKKIKKAVRYVKRLSKKIKNTIVSPMRKQY